MGTITSSNDEWIELYNNTQNSITLDGWRLIAQNETPNIILSGIIPANGFYLLERTNDETVSNISADKIYTGALGNSGEHLILYDNLNNIIDEIDCSAGWISGDNATKQTMEKVDRGPTSTSWQASENPRGTPKAKNSDFKTILATSTKEAGETIPVQKIDYPKNIFINEILPSPEGPDETEEWIELFNENDFEADLSGWQIKDTIGTIKAYVFPKETKVESFGFLVLKRPETKIVLQNNGDGLELINPNKEIADKASYEKAPQGQSFNRTARGWLWSETLTPGKENSINQALRGPSPIDSPEGSPLENSEDEKLSQAQISQNLPAAIRCWV